MRIGEILAERYEIKKMIGKGGMSVVYLTEDIRLHRRWAVKEIAKTSRDGRVQAALPHLREEAELLKSLDHPALPRVVDILEDESRIILVMDYIEGESLYRMLQKKGRFSEQETAEAGRQLCDVLHYLHTRKPPVIYRDMKPSNVIRKPNGTLALVDFGIAREYKEDQGLDTMVLGTEGYAAPEQHGRGQSDQRSDIFALGMTMIHLLTGTDPRHDPYLYRVHPIRKMAPGTSEGMEIILNRCTAFRPEDRYQNCLELKRDLDNPAHLKYRNWQKRRLLFCALLCVLLVLLPFLHVVSGAVREWSRDREYQRLLADTASVSLQERMENCKKAIALNSTNPEAYQTLLELWQERGTFTEEDSRYFTEICSRNREMFSVRTEDVLELDYQAGVTYLYLYSGGDGSFRNRMRKALFFFQEISESGDKAFPEYRTAQIYCQMGMFYQDYVWNSVSVREPEKEDYEALLRAFRVCLKESAGRCTEHEASDAGYVSLLLDQEVLNILNDQRRGMAAAGIPEEEILSLVIDIRKNAGECPVTQEKSVRLQEEVLRLGEVCRDNVRRTYENV